jgi:hypothetical protein
MADIKISEFTQYTGNTSGVYLIMNDNTETQTFKVTKETLNEGLISGSSQITYSGLTGIPSGLISGSSQVVYSGITNIPSGIVSGASQITNLGFATTGSQTLIGNQTVNGDLVVTGSITAQQYIVSSSVYYVTASSISGSSSFGNSLDDTHNFTGSVNISGSIGADLWQLRDVNDVASGSIVNGYQLAWNGSVNQWEPTPGASARGSIRIFVAENASNNGVFYFNAVQVTALASASPGRDTAFMLTSNLLSTVKLYLRSDQNNTNSVRVDLYKNPAGQAFATATTSIANQTNTLTQYNVATYTFSGLTLNQFDSIHVRVSPTLNPGNLYGIITIE